jgi:hypothetical protein
MGFVLDTFGSLEIRLTEITFLNVKPLSME